MTCKEYFEDKLSKTLSEHPEKAKEINAVYQFDLTGDEGGTWVVDLTEPAVTEGASDKAQCTLTSTAEDFLKILSGEMNAQMAFLQGKLKISGDMSLALKLTQVLKT